MKTLDYLIDGALAGNSVKSIIEELTQLKQDRARGLAKRYGVPLETLIEFGNIDPTANGAYMEWMAKLAKANNNTLPVDGEAFKAAVEKFEQIKRLPAFTGDKNIMSYRSYEAFDDVLSKSQGVQSNMTIERGVKQLFAQVHAKYPVLDVEGQPIVKSGYYPWIMSLAKTKDIVLPEDGYKVMDAIDAFEAAKDNPKFTGSRQIGSYRTLNSLTHALAEVEEDSTHVPIQARIEAEGVEFMDSTIVNGHYYDMYAVTTDKAASIQFAKDLFPKGDVGWCVKDPFFFNSQYHMGPKNPAFFFRRDGIPLALMDRKSGHVMDTCDKPAKPALIFELLYLNMPVDLKKQILNIHPWTRKQADDILNLGVEKTILKVFKSARGEGDPAELANDAIEYWVHFQQPDGSWIKPPEDAMDEIRTNPILASSFATRVHRKRMPEFEPMIFANQRAAISYYDELNEIKALPGGKFPELEPYVLEYAKQGRFVLAMNYAFRTHTDIPGLAELFKEKNPKVYPRYLSMVKASK
jgi:hypothetical protein